MMHGIYAGYEEAGALDGILDGMDFSGQRLNSLSIPGYCLSKCKFVSSILDFSDFRFTDLTSASFKNVFLFSANFFGSKLVEVNFTGSNLADANLARTDLTGANLTRATLTGADLTGADLRRARGLTRKQLNVAASINGAQVPDNLPED